VENGSETDSEDLMPFQSEYATATYTATATALCITSANAYIVGIAFQGSATNSARLWAGTTATSAAAGKPISGIIYANATAGTTANSATFLSFPAYCSGGITIQIIGAGDPSVTLFWNPAGGA
jgi:hypothetical protein